MLEWNDLAVILAVGRAGTLSGAARHLGVNHSTVFRKITAIESRVGVRFFDRLPSGYRMTEAGEAAVACAERIEGEIHSLGREIVGLDTRLQGHVRVTAMEGLAALVLPAPLAELSKAHPGLSIEIVGTVSALDLSRREAEVAVRATRRPPEAAFGRKICPFRFGLYAAPSYLERHRDVPITQMDWCLLHGIVDWLVPHVFKKRRDIDERIVMTGNSIFGVVEATAASAGVTALPTYFGETDDRLVRVGDLLDHLTLDLWVLTHADLRQTARVKVTMDFLYEVLQQRRDHFDPPARPPATSG